MLVLIDIRLQIDNNHILELFKIFCDQLVILCDCGFIYKIGPTEIISWTHITASAEMRLILQHRPEAVNRHWGYPALLVGCAFPQVDTQDAEYHLEEYHQPEDVQQ